MVTAVASKPAVGTNGHHKSNGHVPPVVRRRAGQPTKNEILPINPDNLPAAGPQKLSEDRAKLLDDMKPASRELVIQYEKRISQSTVANVLVYYDLGQSLRSAVEDESRYGTKVEQQIATYLSLAGGDKFCANLRRFSSSFQRQDVVAGASRRQVSGHEITLSHWIELSKLKSEKDRHKWFNLIVSDSLSVNELQDRMRGEGAGLSNQRTSGRKPKPARTAAEGLQKIKRYALQLRNYLNEANEGVIQPLLDMPSDKLSPELHALMASTMHMAKAAETKLAEFQADVLEPLKRSSRLIKIGIPEYVEPD